MPRLITTLCLALAVTLSLATTSFAHKVNIFAFVDGNKIVTDSGYSRTKRVHDGIVEVHDAATGTMLLSGPTNEDGKFEFGIPNAAREGKMNLRLLLKAGSGHQAEWTVKYDEYGNDAPATPTGAPTQDEPAVAVPASSVTETPQTGAANNAEIQAIVHRELEPVKQMLADLNQTGPGVTEIIGGIGYILGLFGIVAYMKSRKSH